MSARRGVHWTWSSRWRASTTTHRQLDVFLDCCVRSERADAVCCIPNFPCMIDQENHMCPDSLTCSPRVAGHRFSMAGGLLWRL